MSSFIHRQLMWLIRSQLGQIVLETGLTWQRTQCLDIGASLAYFALFSLFPLIMVILSVFGFVLGPESDIYAQITVLIETSLPPEAVDMVESTLRHLNESSVGAGITGFVLVLFTASGFFSALDRAITRIWAEEYVSPTETSLASTARQAIWDKLSAFALTISSGALVLLSQASNLILQFLLKGMKVFDRFFVWIDFNELLLFRGVEILMTLLLLTLVIMALYRILPTCPLTWRDVAPGALTTAGLFFILEHLINNSVIHLGSTYLSYGVLGGVMVLLIWLFLSCQIFLLGNVFTFVYAHHLGSRSARSRHNPEGQFGQ